MRRAAQGMLWAALAVAQAPQIGAASIARATADDFAQGRYAQMRARFTPRMLDALNEQRLGDIGQSLFPSAGAYQGVTSVTCEPVQEFQRCVTTASVDGSQVILRVTVDQQGRVAGFFIGETVPAWLMFTLPLVVIAPAAAIFHVLPVMRKETFFAVHVPPAFRESPDGAPILGSYRRWNAMLALLGAGVLIWSLQGRNGWAVIVGPLLHSLGMIAVMYRSRTRVWPHRVETQAAVRVAELAARSPLPLWTGALWVAPALILAGAALYLGANWDSIPDRFPVHWGPSGQPDRWADKSFKGVFGVLIICGSVMLDCYALAAAVLFGARRSASEVRMLRAFSVGMIGIMAGVSSLFAVIALNALSETPNQLPIPRWAALCVSSGIILLSIVPMWRASNEATERGDPTPDECWRLGAMIYVNPDDPAWMVRNRIGHGYSPNLGHPAMRLAFPAMFLQTLLVVIYVAS